MRRKAAKTTIRRRILYMMGLLILVGVGTGISLGYIAGYNLIQRIVGENHRQMARLLAQSLSETISEKMHDIRTYLDNPEFINAILESNFRYETMDIEAIQGYLEGVDRLWADSKMDTSRALKYLDATACVSLERLAGIEPTISEIFLTNRYGGLVASSGSISDFYQADEEWWYRAFNGGRGRFFIGDIEYDKSSGVWGVPIAIPVRDDDLNLQGICKVVLDINTFFIVLEKFSIGETGRAALVGTHGYILFHHGIKPATTRLCSLADFDRIIKSKRRWQVLSVPHLHKGRLFMAFSEVEHPLLSDGGITWRVFIHQDTAEVFAPLKIYLLQGLWVIILLLIILIPSSLVLSRRFAQPIVRLREATEHIARGKLDYPIKIDTQDEVGALADSFKDMISNIKDKQQQLLSAKTKLEEWSKTLEKKVAERTWELEESQKATLNIMEDLQEAYNKLKDTQNQLVHAEKMEAVGRMASGVAHEVKNPLGIVLQGIDYIKKRIDLSDNKGMEVVEVIRSNVERADNIVSSLVDFSRASELNIMPQEVDAILVQSLALIGHRAKLEDIEVIKDIEEGLPMVMADKIRMEQVFINILLNAIDAMDNGGTLFLRVYKKRLKEEAFRVGRRKSDGDFFEPGEEAVSVEVEDTGCGIPEENMHKIFDPFFTTKRMGAGTGLGLSVTKNIIELHRGIIEVESSPGKGTRVTITLKTAKGG